MATKIMIIRHGEKPSDDGSIRGVDQTGLSDADELTVRGWQRAGGLIRLFAPPNKAFSHPSLATPETLFACAPHGHVQSVRAVHTIQLLAQFLNKKVDVTHQTGAEDQLVKDVMTTQGVVLIAWEHDAIPDIAAEIVKQTVSFPKKWPDARFDVVWVFDLKPGSTWTFTQAPQLVLPGDLAEVISLTKGAS